MYKVYKTTRGKLFELERPAPDCWVDLSSPTEEELNELKSFFEIPEEVLVSVKDVDEVPKLEEVDNFNFIVIQTPFDLKEGNLGYLVKPLGILYNKDYVITITDGYNDITNYLRTKLKNFSNNKIINTSRKQQLILKLILFTSKIYLRYLKAINHNIHIAQEEMGKSFNNEDIINLMDVRKSLTYFNRALHSNNLVVEKLSKRKMFTSTEEDEELTQDVIDENKQALETSRIYENIVTNTANTFATIVSNNVNHTVKFLTIITILLMLPTLVASIYGMNIKLPYQDSPFAFDIVMGVSFFLVLLGIILFYRKKLF
jgi:magnesium transporter